MKILKSQAILIFLILSMNGIAQWSNQDLGLTGREILCFAVKDTNIIAGTNGGLVRSTNNGVNWLNLGGGLPYTNVRALLNVNSYPFDLLLGMVSGRISKSSNYGENCTGFPVDSVQLPFLADINCILEKSNSSNFIVGTERGVYLLPQYYPLSTWIAINTGLPSAETRVRAIVEKDGDVFVGTNSGVFQLNGFDWTEKSNGLTNLNVTALANINGNLFAGTSQGSVGGVYISTDNGSTWAISLNDGWITSIYNVGSNIFVGSFGNGVWRSTNNGNTWTQINDGLASGAYYVMSLGSDDQYLFAGTNGSNIWRRPLSQIVTDAEVETNTQPTNFVLEQNYPNPFNPSTKIRYSIPQQVNVKLKVYDLLGNEVVTLVNEIKSAGNYEIEFSVGQSDAADSPDIATGIYFYRLQTGDFIQSKKMILIK